MNGLHQEFVKLLTLQVLLSETQSSSRLYNTITKLYTTISYWTVWVTYGNFTSKFEYYYVRITVEQYNTLNILTIGLFRISLYQRINTNTTHKFITNTRNITSLNCLFSIFNLFPVTLHKRINLVISNTTAQKWMDFIKYS